MTSPVSDPSPDPVAGADVISSGPARAGGRWPPLRSARLALLLGLALALVAAIRVVPIDLSYPWSVLEEGALWVLLPTWPALAWAIRWRVRPAGAVLALVATAHLLWAFDFVPRRLGADAPGGGATLRLVSTNLLAPRPSHALARHLRARGADLLAMTELSDEWVPILDAEGVLEPLPERAFRTLSYGESYFGIGLASRFPIVAREDVEIGTPAVRVELDVSGARLRLWVVHPFPPSSRRGVEWHRRSLRALGERLAAEADDGVPTVVAGDLNCTPQTRAFRELLERSRLVAAHDLAGNPFACTWPMTGWEIPPLFRIDHVLVRGVGVREVALGDAVTSDHAPLVVDLELPRP